MEAATPEKITAVLQAISQRPETETTLHSISAVQGFLKVKMPDLKITATELAALSDAFLTDHRANIKGILGASAYSMPEVDFIFLPIVQSIAVALAPPERATVIISLGLIEVLRLGCIAGHLDSAVKQLEANPEILEEIGANKLERLLRILGTMTQYLNASAVLHFNEPGVLPNVAAALDASMQHRAGVTLEAVLMFVLLHELGHIDFHRRNAVPDDNFVWEFAVAEQLDARKQEELYADNFALRSVPEAFMLPLVHAATFFLHLHNYVEVIAAQKPGQHPLSVNRLSALYASAKNTAKHDDVGHLAVNRALDAGSQFWLERSGIATSRLPALRRFVETCSQVDWRPIQEALQVLAAHPTASAGDL